MANEQGGDDLIPSIGPVIRRARQQRHMTIAQLAEASGLSKGFISLVERDHASLSIPSLLRLCKVLDIRFGSLFEPAAMYTKVVRADQRPRITGSTVVDHLLTPSGERALEVLETHVAPGGSPGPELYSFSAETEFIYVITGRIEVIFGEETVELAQGDALTFAASQPHTLANPSSETTRLLVVLAPAT